jgi:A/G-specific adenine glycosylase
LAVETVTPELRAGDFAQGLMDLAATICTPRAPKCEMCPVSSDCAGREQAEEFPAKLPKKARPERQGIAWWIEEGGKVWLVRRPARGLLGGMRALPSSETITPPEKGIPLGTVAHVFTHFRLTLSVVAIRAERGCALQRDGEWWPIDRLDEAGLPTVFAKAAARALTREE